MPVRIGVNALYLIPGGVGGTEIYLRSLLAALARIDAANQYVLFTNRETGPDLAPVAANFHIAPQPVSAVHRPARILWEQTGLAVAAARARVDVLFNPGFTAPALAPCRTLTVFHDLQHKRHPEYFRWFDLPFWEICLFQAACTSDRLLAVSAATRDDLLLHYPVDPRRVAVVPHGVDDSLFGIGRSPDLSEPYLLCVSTLHPHKNLERLVRAFAAFRREQPSFRLVLAGLRGFHAGVVERLIRGLGLEGAVQVTGWLPRVEIHALYRGAHASIQPSIFEGFGLPVLESLAAGVPTACSAIPPHREVAADAALLFDPLDDDAVLDAMRRIGGDQELRHRLSADGPMRARSFSWNACARSTLGLLVDGW